MAYSYGFAGDGFAYFELYGFLFTKYIHYFSFQIAWANTKYVGCALNYCRQLHDPNNGADYPSALYLVCNYGPG